MSTPSHLRQRSALGGVVTFVVSTDRHGLCAVHLNLKPDGAHQQNAGRFFDFLTTYYGLWNN